ncbi:DUF4123 domain-containing protein [Vreelandella malpeensis]|uniref:DUF4123 domain-containing protein n=1 Tax=Vreelandella malpeensis TaxID=1172368 RepID=A0ABS8DNV8_9GAMM|nr:DUF4123 domain-containing protein [Halomonas malpeensis]MCB8887984.1 DUF4123 domain-containing protein [Halomonas malpeensis]
MSGWLSLLAERSRSAESLSGMVTVKHGYVLLDQRRAPEQCRAILERDGQQDFLTLFAGTPLSPLIEASPWLVEVDVGSSAWYYAETLCQKRLGWLCLPRPDQTLQSLADHLRLLFVLADPHGGRSLINLQQPAAWMALLASAPSSVYEHVMSPFQLVATPTPQGQWLVWQVRTETSSTHDEGHLTTEMEAALKDSQQVWWLSRMTNRPLSDVRAYWLIKMNALMAAGITRSDHLKRLLPVMTGESEAFDTQIEDVLNKPIPSRQKVKQLERFL